MHFSVCCSVVVYVFFDMLRVCGCVCELGGPYVCDLAGLCVHLLVYWFVCLFMLLNVCAACLFESSFACVFVSLFVCVACAFVCLFVIVFARLHGVVLFFCVCALLRVRSFVCVCFCEFFFGRVLVYSFVRVVVCFVLLQGVLIC